MKQASRKLSEVIVQIQTVKMRTGRLIDLHNRSALQRASRTYHPLKGETALTLAADQSG